MAGTAKKTAATSVYVATRSFNEFEEGQSYELRAADAQKWLDRDYLRPADADQVARFGGSDGVQVDDEGPTGTAGSGSSASS
jgi:hypothetical protein